MKRITLETSTTFPADLASRKPTGTGNRPENKDVEYIGDEQLQDDNAELEQFTEAETHPSHLQTLVLAHIDAQSYNGSRHPNHSSEDEKPKLGHFLLAFQDNFYCVLSLKRFGTEWRHFIIFVFHLCRPLVKYFHFFQYILFLSDPSPIIGYACH